MIISCCRRLQRKSNNLIVKSKNNRIISTVIGLVTLLPFIHWLNLLPKNTMQVIAWNCWTRLHQLRPQSEHEGKWKRVRLRPLRWIEVRRFSQTSCLTSPLTQPISRASPLPTRFRQKNSNWLETKISKIVAVHRQALLIRGITNLQEIIRVHLSRACKTRINSSRWEWSMQIGVLLTLLSRQRATS